MASRTVAVSGMMWIAAVWQMWEEGKGLREMRDYSCGRSESLDPAGSRVWCLTWMPLECFLAVCLFYVSLSGIAVDAEDLVGVHTTRSQQLRKSELNFLVFF